MEPERWRVRPGEPLDLSALDPASTEGAPGDKHETKDASKALRDELSELQQRLWAESRQALLVVLQAMDAGGKDGTIRKVFTGVNPQGCNVTSFKQPSEEELAHDFLWRIHKATPDRGRIGIFNRSHYEDVLVVRVEELVSDTELETRYGRILDFERHLGLAGTTIVKLFLHISKEEQAARFRKRLDQAHKRWKFSKGDLEVRERWDEYQAAYRDAIARTSTDVAPWYVVPADHKWFRNHVVLQILVDTLRRMDPQFPEPEAGLDDIVVV